MKIFLRALGAIATSLSLAGSVLADLPRGWTDGDIGGPAQSGSAAFTNGDWLILGGGADIGGTADQFNLASVGWVGDGSIVALVVTQQNTDPLAKAGVMFRNDTNPGSIFVDLVATPGNGVNLQWRSSTGETINGEAVKAVSPPVWLKLVRSGTIFRGYYSLDSVSWTQLGTDQTIPLNSDSLAGLAVNAHNNALLGGVTFENVSVSPPAAVLTQRNDNARTGQNLNETLLTPATVNTNSFGRLFSYAVDGNVYAQPLVMTNVAMPGQGMHNVLFVATEHDSVYAFDADYPTGTNSGLLWKASFIDPANGITTVPNIETDQGNIAPEVGTTSTPVIDPDSATIYVEARTKEVSGATNYVHRLHALDIATGLERTNFNSPAVITATNYPGTGTPGYPDNDGAGHVLFNPLREHSRPGLLLLNGSVYFAYASPGDHSPYHGWVFGYDTRTLAQTGVFNTTPNAGLGGIWQSGHGLTADSSGNIYAETGNGAFDPAHGNYGDSVLKLSTTNGLALADYFTPYNQSTLDNLDLDLGSAGSVVLPDTAGSAAHPRLLLSTSKPGTIYLLDRDNLGQYNPVADTQILQAIALAPGGLWSTPAYFNGTLYCVCVNDQVKAFGISGATINPNPIAHGATTFGYPGASPSVSANGTNDAIVWVLQEDASNGGQAVLHAYNATNVAQELYNSRLVPARDNPGGVINYCVPTVANGKVYVGTAHSVSVFGNALFAATPLVVPNGGTFTSSVTMTLGSATPSARIYYTLDGSVPTTKSLVYLGPVVLTNSTMLKAKAVRGGAVDSPIATATFLITPARPVLFAFFTNGLFQLQLSGSPGKTYVLQGSTDLVNWSSLSTNLAPATLFNLTDPGAANFRYRFYRSLQLP
jgi:hypothetical protein